jgi:co-chaperonin GroES (HSP10)
MTNIEPFGSLVLVEEIEQLERKMSSGLIISSSLLDYELKRGKVIDVGPGDNDNAGNHYDIPLKYGDVVIYSQSNATEVTDSLGNKYFFINWRTLLGKEGTL